MNVWVVAENLRAARHRTEWLLRQKHIVRVSNVLRIVDKCLERAMEEVAHE